MANTADITSAKNTIQVSYSGSGANWDIATDLPGFLKSGLRVKSIHFHPTAANDILRIRNGSATGPDLMYVKCAGDTDQRIKYFDGNGQNIWPYIVLSEQTFNTITSIKIIFVLA